MGSISGRRDQPLFEFKFSDFNLYVPLCNFALSELSLVEGFAAIEKDLTDRNRLSTCS